MRLAELTVGVVLAREPLLMSGDTVKLLDVCFRKTHRSQSHVGWLDVKLEETHILMSRSRYCSVSSWSLYSGSTAAFDNPVAQRMTRVCS